MRKEILALSAAHESLLVLLAEVHNTAFIQPKRSQAALVPCHHFSELSRFLKLDHHEEAEVTCSNGGVATGQGSHSCSSLK